jgi:hypothetical protein
VRRATVTLDENHRRTRKHVGIVLHHRYTVVFQRSRTYPCLDPSEAAGQRVSCSSFGRHLDSDCSIFSFMPSAPSSVSSAPEPGSYRVADGSLHHWDGAAWTTDAVDTHAVQPYASHRRRPFRFLRHRWFWTATTGLVLGLLSIAAAARFDPIDRWLLALAGLLGCGAMLLALSMLVWRRLRMHQLPGQVSLIGWGVLSGIVALGIAVGIELGIKGLPVIGTTVGGLAMAGPIEETAKILVPVIVFFIVGGRLRDPRAGLAMVFVSGVVFGTVEGIEYVAEPIDVPTDDHQRALADAPEVAAHMFALFERMLVEMMHPWLTASVAAVAWLCAWRTGVFFSRTAVTTFVLAVAAHSVNDAVFGGILADSRGAGLILSWIGLAIIYILLFRRNARELVPPDAVAANPPPWRPHATTPPTTPMTAQPQTHSTPRSAASTTD